MVGKKKNSCTPNELINYKIENVMQGQRGESKEFKLKELLNSFHEARAINNHLYPNLPIIK